MFICHEAVYKNSSNIWKFTKHTCHYTTDVHHTNTSRTTTRLSMFYCKCATKLGLEKMLTGHYKTCNTALVLSIP